MPSIDKEKVKNYILEFGHMTNAHMALQDDIDYFEIPNVGLVCYKQISLAVGKANIVFLRPLCEDHNIERLLKEFRETVPGKLLFAGVDSATAKVLKKYGYSVNQMGKEYTMELNNYQITGKKMKYLRNIRHLDKKGVVVKELNWNEVDQDEVLAISQEWMKSKKVKHRELKLLTAPPNFNQSWEERKFFCYVNGKMVGYVFFIPYFKEGRVIGHCAHILRSYPEARPQGILDFTILHAMDIFKAEGIQELSLGLAPLHDLEKVDGEDSGIRRLMKGIYQYGNFMYDFKNLAFHKTRYRGQENPLYFCKKDMTGPFAALYMLRGTGVF